MSNVLQIRAPRRKPKDIENGKVLPPRRVTNIVRRPMDREYLTPDEVAKLIKAAGKTGRHRHRDATLLLLAYRHGLRVGELVALRWDHLDIKRGLLHVHRLKGGVDSTHPVRGAELKALRVLQRVSESPYVFTTERGGPLDTSTVRKLVARAGEEAGLGFPVHPHMLRHATGYALANKGHDTRAIQHYLGHSNIMHTVKYTALAPTRFKDFWRD